VVACLVYVCTEVATVFVDHSLLGIGLRIAGCEIRKLAEFDTHRHTVVVVIWTRVTCWRVQYMNVCVAELEVIVLFDNQEFNFVVFDSIEISLVCLAGRCHARVVGCANAVMFGFIMLDDLFVATNVVGMGVCRDKMVNSTLSS
jgi:hypothetical protein